MNTTGNSVPADSRTCSTIAGTSESNKPKATLIKTQKRLRSEQPDVLYREHVLISGRTIKTVRIVGKVIRTWGAIKRSM